MFLKEAFSGISTDMKFDNLHSSLTCLAILSSLDFAVLINFCTILCCRIWGWPHLGQSKILPVLWNFERIYEIAFLEILDFFLVSYKLIFLAIFTIKQRESFWFNSLSAEQVTLKYFSSNSSWAITFTFRLMNLPSSLYPCEMHET